MDTVKPSRPGGPLRLFAFHASVATLTIAAPGCGPSPSTQQPPIDATQLQAVCDTVPPPRPIVAPTMPSRAASRTPGVGAIVGTVSDVQRGAAVSHAQVDIRRLAADSVMRLVRVDSSGGFAFDSLPPGSYRIRARAFDYRYVEQDVRVRADGVDAIRIALPYYRCAGY